MPEIVKANTPRQITAPELLAGLFKVGCTVVRRGRVTSTSSPLPAACRPRSSRLTCTSTRPRSSTYSQALALKSPARGVADPPATASRAYRAFWHSHRNPDLLAGLASAGPAPSHVHSGGPVNPNHIHVHTI
jgi:hypothetical protein